LEIAVHDLGPLPGLADVVGEAAAQRGHAAAAGSVAARLDAADLPLHATMGVRDSVGSLVAWVRGRTLVRTLEEDIVPLMWFECHVPHGGTAQERFETAQSADAGVAIKAFGSGLDRGRSIEMTVSSEAAAPRAACAFYTVDLRVLPRVYESDGRESVVVEVLGPAAHRTVERPDCPYCTVGPDAVDQFENEVQPPTDLRAVSVGEKRVIKLDWSSERSLDVGVQLPRAGLAVGLNARVAGRGSWSIAYELKPGLLYQEYRPLDALDGAPRWAYSA